jgi:zinc-binding alcohol dehydrogenase/oxidoreductase
VQAIALVEHGPPEVLTVRPRRPPVPRAGEVVVELRAAAVNRRDVLLRAGDPPEYRLGREFVLGSDGAGVRRDTGEEVVVLPSLNWGPAESHAGPQFEILGGPRDGTYAELVVVPVANLYPRPAGYSWGEAAAFGLATLTAYRALFKVGRLTKDERLIILGVGGGVSLAALSLAVAAGARIAVTSSRSDKLAYAAHRGALVGVNYRDASWTNELLESFGPADVVLDSVGSTWPDAIALLRPGGRLVTCGGTRAVTVPVDVRSVYLTQKQILGTKMGSPADFAELLALASEHDLRPLIDTEMPLTDARLAHRRIENGDHFGKLVLSLSA